MRVFFGLGFRQAGLSGDCWSWGYGRNLSSANIYTAESYLARLS